MCSSKRWMSIGSNHCRSFLWTSKCWFPGPQVVQQPAATTGAPSQQAQDAVTMAMTMWRMMNTVLQQQQCMAYPGCGPGMPRTPLHQNAGTPVGMPRSPDGMATPRFPAPIPVHNMPPGMPLITAFMAFPAGRTNQDTTSVLPQHSRQKQLSLQDAQDSESPASNSRLTAFTLDPLTFHRLPADTNETTDRGQQGDEELVPVGESSVRPSGVHWGGFTVMVATLTIFWRRSGSLIPTDDILKDKITWDMQSSFKASLTNCAKIPQGVLTADQINDTPLCAPPTVQKNKFFTLSNMLGK